MNLPNRLTILRIVMTPVFAVLAELALKRGSPTFYFAAAIVFSLASVTDTLDGRIARSRGLITNFGKFADPLADKILTVTALIYLLLEGVCPSAALILILFREFAVSGLRMLAAGSEAKLVIPANAWGKAKTTVTMLSICLFYYGSFFWPGDPTLRTVCTVFCWIFAALTAVSGLSYFKSAGTLLSKSTGPTPRR